MKKQPLLFELGTEELSHFELTSVGLQFEKLFIQILTELNFKFSGSKNYFTPRRLAIIVYNLSEYQKDTLVQISGPEVRIAFDEQGKPNQIAKGFAKKNQVELKDLIQINKNNKIYLGIEKLEKGLSIQEVIQSIADRVIQKLKYAKSMAWGEGKFSFIRPVKWLTVLYGSEVLECELFNRKSCRSTYGHRLLAPQAIELKDAFVYESSLKNYGYVIANYQERREVIEEQIRTQAKHLHLFVEKDEELLDYVTNMVEFPVSRLGKFNTGYLKLPQEVLIHTMKQHQYYFYVANKNYNVTPHFIVVTNILASDSDKENLIIKGYEKVLHARLADANFFFKNDCETGIQGFEKKLKNVTYIDKLGNLKDKSTRLVKMVEELKLDKYSISLKKAAKYAKADLQSEMVQEFPALQGTMGYYYALVQKFDIHTALAIKEHYMPAYATDNFPSTTGARYLSLIDKIDHLVALFASGNIPTSTQDPYSLRRTAIAIVRLAMILPKLKLANLITFNLDLHILSDQLAANKTELLQKITGFINDRIVYYLNEQGYEKLAIQAVLSPSLNDVPVYLSRLNNLIQLRTEIPEQIKLFKDITNRIDKILIKKTNTIQINLAKCIFETQYEQNLYTKYKSVMAKSRKLDFEKLEDLVAFFAIFKQIISEIEVFFDNVMVFVDDEKKKNQRLNLLQALQTWYSQIPIHFNKID